MIKDLEMVQIILKTMFLSSSTLKGKIEPDKKEYINGYVDGLEIALKVINNILNMEETENEN